MMKKILYFVDMNTRDQEIALSTDRHIAVTANAGSGKTRVLVHRYVKLLLQGVNPSEIVAITFTRKAAGEMLTRVTSAIEEMARKAGDKPDELKKLKNIRRRLTNVRISTIHSFCSSILRDHPVEAGIEPNFGELPEAQQARIADDSIIAVMEEWLESEDEVINEKAQKVFRALGRPKLEKLLRMLIGKKEILSAGKVDANTNDAVDFIYQNYKPAVRECTELLVWAAGDIPAGGKLKQNLIEALSMADDLTNDWNSPLAGSAEDLKDLLVRTSTFFLIFFTKSNRLLRKNISKHLPDNIILRTERLYSTLYGLESVIEALRYAPEDESMTELRTIAEEMAKDIADTIEDEKKAIGGIDFSDMIMKADEVLNIYAVRDSLLRGIKYILVDEFQDTNALQYEIVKKLVPDLSGDNRNHDVNLFLVGDAKQSIYGFRNADVRVFRNAAEEISKINEHKIREKILSPKFSGTEGEIIPDSPEESSGLVNLNATFRLQPVIAAFINKVFENIMVEGASDFEVPYEPFVCARNTGQSIKPGIEFPSNDFGNIEFLFHRSKDEDSPGEADLAADRIMNLRNDGQKSKNGIEWRDIAVLARSRNGLDELVKAFQQRKIPYVMHSGSGFYEAQEVLDIISYLNFLNNKNDDIALASVLRSPFFGISDTELFAAANEGGGNNLWEKFINYCLSHRENPDLQRANETLESNLHVGPRLGISRLLSEIVYESAYLGVAASSRSYPQIKANLEKFVRMAGEYESRGFKSLYDFIEEINFLMDHKSAEDEAAFISGDNAVNIMTIHAAKGLEFPVVLLYRVSAKTGVHEEYLYSDKFGATFKAPYLNEAGAVHYVDTPLHVANKIYRHQAEEAEEKRILYVAMTRAKDHLIISGAVDHSGAYMTSLINALDISPDYLEEREDNFEIFIEQKLDMLQDGNKITTGITYPVKFIYEVEASRAGLDEADKISHSEKSLTEEISPDIYNEYFSPSKIMTFLKDRESFLWRYRYGLPLTDNKDAFHGKYGEKQLDNLPPEIPGILIHSALEKIDKWFLGDKADNSELEKVVREIVEGFERPVSTNAIERIIRECNAIAETKLLRAYAGAIEGAEPEKEMFLPFGEDLIAGTVDLLLRDSRGNYEIWDWKSNRLASAKEIERVAPAYEVQLKLYAYLVMLLNPAQEKITARLLFTHLAHPEAEDKEWTAVFEWEKEDLLDFEKELELIKKEMMRTMFG